MNVNFVLGFFFFFFYFLINPIDPVLVEDNICKVEIELRTAYRKYTYSGHVPDFQSIQSRLLYWG